MKDPGWLDYWSDSLVYVESIDHQPRIQTRHLIVSPCEHICVFLEQGHQLLFFLYCQLDTNETGLWVPVLLHIPEILRYWTPFFVSFSSGGLLGHRYPLLLPLPRQVLLGSLAWDFRYLVLAHHRILFPQNLLLLGRRGYGWQGSLWVFHLTSL